MRFDIHKVRTYLINEFNEAPNTIAQVRHDGTDILLVDLVTGESVMIYLVERLLTIHELKLTLTENTSANLHTLFVLWGDMLLPQEGSQHVPEDWMETLFTLYNGKIYGYDSYGPYASVFPVYFTKPKIGLHYHISYGDAITASYLHCDHVHIDTRFLKGFWRVADFSERVSDHAHQEANGHTPVDNRRNSLTAYFRVLDLPASADRAAVRQAYYHLARQYHPDVNQSPDSTAQMQKINEAYQRIMEHFAKEA
jgi:hypothetical protein